MASRHAEARPHGTSISNAAARAVAKAAKRSANGIQRFFSKETMHALP
jgi:hypothetical protein